MPVTVRLKLLHDVSDGELLQLAERNPGYQFERSPEGKIVVTPTGSQGGRRSAEVTGQLRDWNRRTRLGVVFDSSAGFRLPDGSVLSPDASWVRRERWQALTREEQEGFAPLCPDAVFEVRSVSQAAAELREKMHAYLKNGASVAVFIDPYEQAVEVGFYLPKGVVRGKTVP